MALLGMLKGLVDAAVAVARAAALAVADITAARACDVGRDAGSRLGITRRNLTKCRSARHSGVCPDVDRDRDRGWHHSVNA